MPHDLYQVVLLQLNNKLIKTQLICQYFLLLVVVRVGHDLLVFLDRHGHVWQHADR